MPPVVAVFNMKGGVGKTTVSAHLVHTLAVMKQKKVLVLDLDPQFNLTQLLMEEAEYEKVREAGKTALGIFQPTKRVSLFDIVETPIPPPSASAIVTPMDTSKSHCYDLVAGDMGLVRFGILREMESLGGIQARFDRFLGEAKGHYDAIFLDCNPSGSFLTTCALRAADRLLVPVRPDRYSYLGLGHVTKLLGMLPDVHPLPHLDIVMNGEPRSAPMSAIEKDIRGNADYGRALLAAKLFQSKHLHANSDSLGFATYAGGPWSQPIRDELKDVATEYAKRLGW
ncbi:MAG: ParA family protein [Candidatus Thermoplasmatota archaeon]|jgi:chromosome partitioning protein